LTITITSGKYHAEVNPSKSGRVEKFAFQGEVGLIDIFRPKPDKNPEQDGIPLFGSFAMIPFCNRLKPATILTSQGNIGVPRNWSEQSCAIHGLGLNKEWEVIASNQDSCRILQTLKADEENCMGLGMQEIYVSEERGLLSRLGYCNNQFSWIRAGIGFHPWFNLNKGDAQLKFRAKGAFATDANCFPTDKIDFIEQNIDLNTYQDNGIDRCFWGWSGKAVLRLEALNVSVFIESNANHLHVYINKSLNAICVEPVSHVTNAMHDQRWAELAGMNTVNSGEMIWLQMNVRVVPL